MPITTTYGLHDLEAVPLADAEVSVMSEGDLLVALRSAGAHPDAESGIITVEAREDGSFFVRVMTGDASVLAEVVIP